MRLRRWLWVAVASLIAAAALLLVTLAMPVPTWRSGDRRLMPMHYRPVALPEASLQRLWVDADAACGAGARVDPDDCLALALLVRARQPPPAGVSTVFGNAPQATVRSVTSALLGQLAAEGARVPPLFTGAAAPPPPADAPTPATPARDALIAALEAGPLAILALGPLTNIADALAVRPDLAPRVTRLIAVMGRRPGHLFHPAEGAHAGSLLGHGPVFRDFNVAMDPRAVERVVALRLPLTLVPYDAARGVEFSPGDVQALAASAGAGPWIARRLRGWLAYWQRDIGRRGFFPFDLLAAAYVLEPARFGCAGVELRLAKDSAQWFALRSHPALLVSPAEPAGALYCARPDASIRSVWRAAFARAGKG